LPFWSAPTWTICGSGRVVSVPAAELPVWLCTMTLSPRYSDVAAANDQAPDDRCDVRVGGQGERRPRVADRKCGRRAADVDRVVAGAAVGHGLDARRRAQDVDVVRARAGGDRVTLDARVVDQAACAGIDGRGARDDVAHRRSGERQRIEPGDRGRIARAGVYRDVGVLQVRIARALERDERVCDDAVGPEAAVDDGERGRTAGDDAAGAVERVDRDAVNRAARSSPRRPAQ
jgi:hypothetical protein